MACQNIYEDNKCFFYSGILPKPTRADDVKHRINFVWPNIII